MWPLRVNSSAGAATLLLLCQLLARLALFVGLAASLLGSLCFLLALAIAFSSAWAAFSAALAAAFAALTAALFAAAVDGAAVVEFAANARRKTMEEAAASWLLRRFDFSWIDYSPRSPNRSSRALHQYLPEN